mmetsp:Transcript_19298/g.27279  ORF Transcript_19298/g.27279 Transcript_19298/m.27279 type:complete len:211 (+) Transcript_19298:762-1394(+)
MFLLHHHHHHLTLMPIIEAIVCMNATGIVVDMELEKGEVVEIETIILITMIEAVVVEDPRRNEGVVMNDVDMNMMVVVVVVAGTVYEIETVIVIETAIVIVIEETGMMGVVADQEVAVVVHEQAADMIDTAAVEGREVDLLREAGDTIMAMIVTIVVEDVVVGDLHLQHHHPQVLWVLLLHLQGKMVKSERMAAAAAIRVEFNNNGIIVK